jgi:hypothetical protein
MKVKNVSARIYTIDGKQLVPGDTITINDRHQDNPGLPFGTEIEIIETAKTLEETLDDIKAAKAQKSPEELLLERQDSAIAAVTGKDN